jgi:alkaline phosphatase D
MGGHGYALVRASSTDFITEFVCIPRPLERAAHSDGGAVLYRVRFTTPVWSGTHVGKMKTEVIEGDPKFSI